jgi:hypothetical protein
VLGEIGKIDDLEPLKFAEGEFMAKGESRFNTNPFMPSQDEASYAPMMIPAEQSSEASDNKGKYNQSDHQRHSNQMIVTLNETQIKQSMQKLVPFDNSSIRLTNTVQHGETTNDISNFHNYTTLKAAHFMKKGNKDYDLDFHTKSEMMVRQQAILELELFEK